MSTAEQKYRTLRITVTANSFVMFVDIVWPLRVLTLLSVLAVCNSVKSSVSCCSEHRPNLRYKDSV